MAGRGRELFRECTRADADDRDDANDRDNANDRDDANDRDNAAIVGTAECDDAVV